MNHFPYAENRRSWHKFEDTLPGWYNHQTWRDDVRSMILQNWEKYKLSYFWNLYTNWNFTVCVKFSHITAVWGYKSNPSIYIGEGNMNALQYSCLENPWTEEPGGLQSTESWVGHNWATNTYTCIILSTFLHAWFIHAREYNSWF